MIFALAFLVPSLGMSATALAEPSVTIDFYDNGNLEVTTGDADDIDEDQATVWAEIDTVDSDFDFDDYEIMERGFFYSYDQDDLDGVEAILISMDDDWDVQVEDWNGFYEEADFDEEDETEFWADLRNLDDDDEETWFYMAYIEYEDEFGDSYYALGEIEEFDLDEGSGSSDVPEVITNSATDIETDSAILNGELSAFGDDDEITDYGFYYGTSSSPSTKKKVGDDGDNLDEGDEFDYELSGLESGTKYYFKAYARNAEGIGYGSVKNFTTKEGATAPTTSSSVFTIGMNYYLLNGSYQVMDAAPYIKNSRTYMPIRYVGYAMGLTDAQIQWYEATRTVILTKGGTTVVLVIGSNTMFVNGVARTMDVPPEITNSRTCLPIAWVASAFGHTAVWNGATQQVTITGVTIPGSVEDVELKLNRTSLTLEPEDDATITGTLDGVDIDDVEWDIAGDRVVSVDVDIDGDSFKATIEIDEDADDGDEATITFTVTDADGNEYEADLDVSVENEDDNDEVTLSRTSLTMEPGDSRTITGTLDVGRNDIDDVVWDIDGDEVVSVDDLEIDGDQFEVTIKVDEDAENRDKDTITFTVTDDEGDDYEVELDVTVRD